MNRSLENKTAVVTGASQGIGKAIALELGRAGANVVLAARTRERLEQVAEEVGKVGSGLVLAVPTDLTKEESIKKLAATVEREFGRLDILVNNAGQTLSRTLEETTCEEWDQVIATNARSAFLLCRESVRLLRQAQPGYIVNISSVVGVKGYPKQIAYTASKHAMRGMSIAMAEELREDNIRVHVICPGGVLTEMVDSVRPDIQKDELILPEEIAELVRYLVTHEGKGVVDEIRIRRATSGPWF
jgi:NAD(P)-dependent dehydrogenase (short-subunit alcohol dehydrogenase family)